MAEMTAQVTLRKMTHEDLALVRRWLVQPHVARWWSDDPAEQIAEFALAIQGHDPTHVMVIELSGEPIGWCQWYRWADDPDIAPEYGAAPDDLGFDYGIGEVALIGQGLGTAAIAALISTVRKEHPKAPILVAVSTLNAASRAVLERNGFGLVDVRAIDSEPGDEPTALYRLVSDFGRA